MNGTPVRPSTDTIVSALPAASEPPAANSTSCQPMPGVARARARAATAAISQPGHALVPAERVDADADDRDVVTLIVLQRARRHRSRAPSPPGAGTSIELHRHPDAQPRRIGLGEPRLDAHLAGQLDVADAVGLEVVRRRRRRAATSAGSTGSSRSTASRGGEPALRDVARRARARTSPGAGTRRRRSGGTREPISCGAPRVRRSGRRDAAQSAGIDSAPASNAIAGDRATM